MTSLPPGFNRATQRCNVLPPTVSRMASTCGRSCSKAGWLESMMELTPNERSRSWSSGRNSNGNDVDPRHLQRHLYGVGPYDVPGGSDDYYRLSAHRLCILK